MADPALEFLVAPAFLAILVVAWAFGAVLAVAGRTRGRPAWTGGGVALLGALALGSGLAWALGAWPSASGGYIVTSGDLLFLGLLGFLGGVVTAFGATIASWAARKPRRGSP